jgi:cysteinyl-tRNA synthetase
LPATAADAGLAAAAQRVALGESARALLEEALGESGALDEDITLVERAVAALDEARASKDYARSDALRAVLNRAGIAVRNTTSGTEWSVDGST